METVWECIIKNDNTFPKECRVYDENGKGRYKEHVLQREALTKIKLFELENKQLL